MGGASCRHDRPDATAFERLSREALAGGTAAPTVKGASIVAGDYDMARWLIGIGLVLVVAGLMWPWIQKLGLGRLPGDIVIERENARIYIPIVTSVLVSVVLSLVLWLINRQ
jgi:hypothetical protein